ncbi:MAG: hypothetical protein HQ580_09515 [Planctomycetes bacterium]|nr:hypothetical protein [Planctomycetota bacterium]
MGTKEKIKVKARILREMKDNSNVRLANNFTSFDEYFMHEDLRKNFIGFTTVLYNPNDRLLYCGIASYENDIFYSFNPKTKKFKSLKYNRAKGAEKYDVKVHRSLCLDVDCIIYGATACLHGVPEYWQAPGGKIFKYDPKTNKLEIIAIPLPHLYIQTIVMDTERKIIYGCTYPQWHLFRYDIRTNRTKDLGPTLHAPHRPVIDNGGNLWSYYRSLSPVCNPGLELLKYNPNKDKVYYGPWPKSCQLIRKGVDDMLLGPDGNIYIGSVSGELMRFNPKDLEMEYLGKPFHSTRMDLKFGSDGLLYIATGSGKYEEGGKEGTDTAIFTYDVKKEKFEFYGYIYDKERKEGCVMVHDIALTSDGIIYVAESDNHARTCYLWECIIQ